MPNEIRPAGEQYGGEPDKADRAEGMYKLKRRMGGTVPWYKEQASTPAWVDVHKKSDMADSVITSMKVPRRAED